MTSMSSNHCLQDCLPFVSPVSDFANFLLNGDTSKGYQGLLVRTIDRFFDDTSESALLKLLHEHYVEIEAPLPPIAYIPSSYLHATMKAPGAIFQDESFESFSIMVGTKFANNTALHQFQAEGHVGCDVVYPTDSTSLERGSFLGKDFCYEHPLLLEVCVDGDCLANGPKSCGGCKADPHSYGDLVGQYIEKGGNGNEKLYESWHVACYYDTFSDAVIASNSLWKERERWSWDPHHFQYKGYTECTSSARIAEIGMADAIIFPLQRLDPHIHKTVADFWDFNVLATRLQEAYSRGYGDHPVLWYRESEGMHDVEACSRLFQGNGCEEAWKKEFFSQEFVFPNNSCVYKPPGCDETYFFPAAKNGEECSAFTEEGKERIARLSDAEKVQDARVAWEQFVVGQRTGVQTVVEASKRKPATEVNGQLRQGRIVPSVEEAIMYHPLAMSAKPVEELWVSDLLFLTLGVLASMVLMRSTKVFHIRLTMKT